MVQHWNSKMDGIGNHWPFQCNLRVPSGPPWLVRMMSPDVTRAYPFQGGANGVCHSQCFAEAENVLAGFGVALAGPADCRFYGKLFGVPSSLSVKAIVLWVGLLR